jgi:cysteine desulfurase / selenocysteine lyase
MSISPELPYQELFVGLDALAPVYGGADRPYVNLDNAASTPPFKAVKSALDAFLPYYSSVHRGTGFKSQLSTHAYEQARAAVMEFVGANSSQHTCIFSKNTTESINKLARRFPFSERRDVVVTSGMEHHSNDLPWRAAAHTVHAHLTPEGELDESHFDSLLEQYRGRVALVAITGASNVTGYLNPVHRLAEKAHRAGAQILVDCAQLAPHRQVEIGPLGEPASLDFIAISAHKMYAPLGAGALIGRRDIFEQGDPDLRGGGTVEIVTLDDVVWAGPPDRDEAGSPNTVGAVALHAAVKQLGAIGMDRVAQHEAELTAYALEQLLKLPGIKIYGSRDPERSAERLGVIPLQVKSVSHFQAASILGYEFGIGVRSGCFCAHPYILHLLGLSPDEAEHVRQTMLAGDKSDMPGLIRASFGLYNTRQDVDALVDALGCITRGQFKGKYVQDRASGEYSLPDWAPDFSAYLGGL